MGSHRVRHNWSDLAAADRWVSPSRLGQSEPESLCSRVDEDVYCIFYRHCSRSPASMPRASCPASLLMQMRTRECFVNSTVLRTGTSMLQMAHIHLFPMNFPSPSSLALKFIKLVSQVGWLPKCLKCHRLCRMGATKFISLPLSSLSSALLSGHIFSLTPPYCERGNLEGEF